MYKLGVIGAGHMGMTVLDGAVRAGVCRPDEICVCEISAPRRAAALARGFAAGESLRAVYEDSEYLLLAVLPQAAADVLAGLAACAPSRRPVVVSIVAGMRASFVRKHLGGDTAVITVAPNLTLQVGMGATAMAVTENISEPMLAPIRKIFESGGQVALTDETMLEDIIPANGCAPGYAFYMIDAVARAAEARGVDYAIAVRMAAAAFGGAAQMLLRTDTSPREYLAQVCSPNGLTEKGVKHFDAHGLDKIIMGGAWASADRGRELALL